MNLVIGKAAVVPPVIITRVLVGAHRSIIMD